MHELLGHACILQFENEKFSNHTAQAKTFFSVEDPKNEALPFKLFGLNKGEQVGVDLIFKGGTHPVRCALVDL